VVRLRLHRVQHHAWDGGFTIRQTPLLGGVLAPFVSGGKHRAAFPTGRLQLLTTTESRCRTGDGVTDDIKRELFFHVLPLLCTPVGGGTFTWCCLKA
jgi:hypothetical protein